MNRLPDIKKFPFYLWTGLAFLVLWLLSELSRNPATFGPRVVNNIWRAAYVVAIHFILFEFTIPYVRQRRSLAARIFTGVFFLWVHMMLYSFGLFAWRGLGIFTGVWTPLVEFDSVSQGVASQMSYSMGSVFFFGIVKHIYDHIKLKQAAQQLRIQKQEAELNYLKSQTNPHFLFNTLNNIYSLARDKSDLAPESILRLSKILRFMLYEAGGAYVAIEQELKILTDYLALEQLRYDETLRIDFKQEVENRQQQLPPLLLIPLVENAFKHGVSETRTQPFVRIHLSLKDRRLSFVVENSTEDLLATVVKENIGLSNLRRQLELLYTDYSLTVQPGKEVFTATLKINLESDV